MLETRLGRMRRLRFEAGVRDFERAFARIEAEMNHPEDPKQSQVETEAKFSDEKMT